MSSRKAPAARGGGLNVVALAQRHRGGYLTPLSHLACVPFLFQPLVLAHCLHVGVVPAGRFKRLAGSRAGDFSKSFTACKNTEKAEDVANVERGRSVTLTFKRCHFLTIRRIQFHPAAPARRATLCAGPLKGRLNTFSARLASLPAAKKGDSNAVLVTTMLPAREVIALQSW